MATRRSDPASLKPPDDAASAAGQHLAVIEQLRAVLSAARVRFWLRGGWAVDFLLGAVTRPHTDVDAVSWRRHRPLVRRVLGAAGFRVVRETGRQIDFAKDGIDVTFVFLARRGGRIVTHGIPEWTWRPDALPLGWRRLGRAACRVVSAQQLLEEKVSDPRPPRPKDAASIAALRCLVGTPC